MTSRFRLYGAGVLLAEMLLVAVIYWPTRHLAFASDAWVYLGLLRDGLWPTVLRPIGYHWQPVSCLWVALLRATCGESALGFQFFNLVQLTLIGHLTYLIGQRVLRDRLSSFLASLLVLGNAAFYEATYWPLAGNMHLLGDLFYLLSIVLAYDMGVSRSAGLRPLWLGLAALAAVFSHPAMITVVPVCALILFLAGGGRQLWDRAGRIWMLKALWPLAVVSLGFVAARLVFASYVRLAPAPGFEPMRAYWLVSRGLVAVFSLRGSHDDLHHLLTLGTNVGFGSSRLWVFVAGWMAVATAAAWLWLRYTRRTELGPRILVGFLGVHLVILSYAGGTSSRQSVVLAVPAALISVWALKGAARRLQSLAARVRLHRVCQMLPAAVVFLLIAGAIPDHRTAATLGTRAGDLVRELVERLTSLVPPPGQRTNLTLINTPGYLSERGIGSPVFSNGLHLLGRMISPAFASVDLRYMPIEKARESLASGSRPLSQSELRRQLAEPNRVVLLLEKTPLGIRHMRELPAQADGSHNLP